VTRPLPIAILVSGEGTTLEGLAEKIARDELPARIVLVVADRAGAPAIERARRRGIPAIVLPSKGVDLVAWSQRLTQELESHAVELVVNAGFLTILPPAWVDRWQGRAVNLHPSLLPRHGGPGLYGERVHRAVLAAGDRETGATVHLVTSEVDRGPTIAQDRLEVLPGETEASLRHRLHPIEVELLATTIRRFAEGSLPLPYPERGPATPGHSAHPT
jgi:phosphoribosylglycinamide formyltransferase 1